MTSPKFPGRFRTIAGPLPAPGALDAQAPHPFGSLTPVYEGFVERDGVKLWHAVWGTSGPWLAFAPPFQIVHSALLKGVVPYLAQHFRVVTMDGRGNGRSDRPRGQDAYSFDLYFGDFVAVLDAVGADRVALVGISAAAMTVLRLAAEQPQRVSHVVSAGGFAHSIAQTPELAALSADEVQRIATDWPKYLDSFMALIFNEPHSTKPYEDGVHYGWASDGETIAWAYKGWQGNDVREHARRVACPTLVMHGDQDRRVPFARGEMVHELVPGSKLVTIGSGGHVTAAICRSGCGLRSSRAIARSRCAWPRPTGSPSTPRRVTSSARANGYTRSASAWPTRAAISRRWPVNTTCRPSSRCARSGCS